MIRQFGVYVASSTFDIDRVRRVQAMVRKAGGLITFDWTDVETPGQGEIREDWRGHHERARELSMREKFAVINADLVILVSPSPGHGLGCFIEVGMAMGRGIPVLIAGPIRESVFWYLENVTQVSEAMITLIVSEAVRQRQELFRHQVVMGDL
jgi:hypothetical protein